jgi:hypothetical protein
MNWVAVMYELLETGHARDLGYAFDRVVPDKRHDGAKMEEPKSCLPSNTDHP